MTPHTLTMLLQVSALTQAALAIVNLFLVRMMGWKACLNQLPLLARQVFVVHCWFISATLAIFASTTWLFVTEMAGGANASMTWFSSCIASFWTIRFILQWTYYSRSHWMGRPWPTVVHLGCSFVYGSWSLVYWLAAFEGWRA